VVRIRHAGRDFVLYLLKIGFCGFMTVSGAGDDARIGEVGRGAMPLRGPLRNRRRGKSGSPAGGASAVAKSGR
jgi:hypothetical protein